MLVLSLFFSLSVWASPFFRLDAKSFEEVTFPEKGIVTFISQECSICKVQLKDFKECGDLPVVLFMDTGNEEKTRRTLKTSPLGHPVYLATEKIKKDLGIGKMRPTSIVINGKRRTMIEGRIECDKLRSLL